MARGGARNRSGPPKDENSIKSAQTGVVFTALPADGYKGRVPKFPLPRVTDRENEVWKQAWRTPQAAAWSVQPWRHRTVAMWVRWSVRMEDPDASAALGNVVVRFADQIGMTPAGLKENGWKVAEDEVARKRQEPTKARTSARDRFRVARASDGA